MALFRNLRSMLSPTVRYVYGGDYGVRVENMDAAALYRTQPNLRAVVSYLADNAAQVPLKVHERRSETDRPRVLDSPGALLMQQPNPDMTPFEFKRWLYSDLLIYERSVWLILPSAETRSGWEMRPVPATWVQSYTYENPYAPSKVIICPPGGSMLEVPSDKFMLFHGYDPTDPMRQYSRISALKETLQEQIESNRFRRQMWHRGGRFNAYLTRPVNVSEWSEKAYDRFLETWKETWAGDNAGQAGGMPILEDGMEIKSVPFNSRDAQWADSVKLSREDAASVYHVNPALIWPGSGQTYASAKDNARALYNETLAPMLMQVSDRLNADLLPRIGEPSDDYIAYDITIKTQGSHEEKIAALQAAVGRPFMTANEARAEMDMAEHPDGDGLVIPLNVLVGGLAAPNDTDPTVERYNSLEAVNEARRALGLKEVSHQRKSRGQPSESDADAISECYRRFFKRQAKSVLPKIGAKSDWWDADRWNAELADDLFEAVFAVSVENGKRTVGDLWPSDAKAGEPGYDAGRTEAYVRSMCRRRAAMVNQATYAELEASLDDDEYDEDSEAMRSTPQGVFEYAENDRSASAGAAFAAAVVGWSMLEACRQNKRRGENVMKTWRTTSGKPRASHAHMNGETVQYDKTFSNGAQWPGDCDVLDVEDVANCKCVIDIFIDD